MQLRDHRWRTRDQAKAELFVIPIAPGVALQHARGVESMFYSNSSTVQCEYTVHAVHRAMEVVLKSASWNRRGGLDHVVCDTDWANFPHPFYYPFTKSRPDPWPE